MDESSEDEYVYEEEEDYEDTNDSISNEVPSSVESKKSRTISNADELPFDGDYVIKPMDDIVPYMTRMMDEVSPLLGTHPDQTQVLLQKVLWDKEKLMERFFADNEKLFMECGLDLFDSDLSKRCIPKLKEGGKMDLVIPNNAEIKESSIMSTSSSDEKGTPTDADGQISPKRLRSNNGDAKSLGRNKSVKGNIGSKAAKDDKSDAFKCRICYDERDVSEEFGLGCSHGFCYDCYAEYVDSQISEGPACIYMSCPEYKCNQIIPREIIVKLADAELLQKYDVYVRRNFIDSNKSYRYCPAPGCDKVFVGSGVTNVKCSCSHNSCFRCGDEAHEPCSCNHLEAWSIKCSNESETANWILVNTKKCPNCNSRIEKNQGCMHMNCKMCKHEFCWVCMGPWSEHGQQTGGYYKCNRFEGKELNSESNEADRAKAELDRYLHYYQRYHGHDHSLKFANELRATAERRMEQTQEEKQSSWLEVQFLKQAAEQVIECRRLLKYTYVLGYFLEDKTPEKTLFEHHQEMLEKNTERLHEVSEQEIKDVDRTQVINLTRITEKFMSSLMDTMGGGSIHFVESDGISESAADVLMTDGYDHK